MSIIPRLKLVDHWFIVLTQSWSAIFASASFFFSAADIVLSVAVNYYTARWLMYASAATAVMSAYSRIVVQWKLRNAVSQAKAADAIKPPTDE